MEAKSREQNRVLRMKPIVTADVVIIERGLRSLMFEKYTEPARRTIFFARYEASQCGNPEILPEHLLLGILREDRACMLRLLGESADLDAIRRQIEQETPHGDKTKTSVDLPMSLASKRALAYGAE